MKENMKRLLGTIAQAVIISTIAIVAVLNSSVQSAKQEQTPVGSHVTVVSTSE
jgi:hypothetical protein